MVRSGTVGLWNGAALCITLRCGTRRYAWWYETMLRLLCDAPSSAQNCDRCFCCVEKKMCALRRCNKILAYLGGATRHDATQHDATWHDATRRNTMRRDFTTRHYASRCNAIHRAASPCRVRRCEQANQNKRCRPSGTKSPEAQNDAFRLRLVSLTRKIFSARSDNVAQRSFVVAAITHSQKNLNELTILFFNSNKKR